MIVEFFHVSSDASKINDETLFCGGLLSVRVPQSSRKGICEALRDCRAALTQVSLPSQAFPRTSARTVSRPNTALATSMTCTQYVLGVVGDSQ